MKTGLYLTTLCSLGATTMAWSNSAPSSSAASSRRAFLDSASKIVPLVVAADAAFADDEAPSASEPVAAAVVEEEAAPAAAVAAVGDENDLIATLKARSEANRAKNKNLSERGDKLSSKQFASQYDRPSFVGVHSASDTEKVTMYLKEDFDKMLASGSVKQSYEQKVNKKTGEVSDDFSKPIYVFAN